MVLWVLMLYGAYRLLSALFPDIPVLGMFVFGAVSALFIETFLEGLLPYRSKPIPEDKRLKAAYHVAWRKKRGQ